MSDHADETAAASNILPFRDPKAPARVARLSCDPLCPFALDLLVETHETAAKGDPVKTLEMLMTATCHAAGFLSISPHGLAQMALQFEAICAPARRSNPDIFGLTANDDRPPAQQAPDHLPPDQPAPEGGAA